MSRYSCALAGAVAAVAMALTPAVASAKKTCDQVPYSDRTQVDRNAAGVIWRPKYDNFHIWDNVRDDYKVEVWFNYAGVKDYWKPVDRIADGGQDRVLRDVSEKYGAICFYIHTISDELPDSPVVRYTTRP